jgi:hypothetical protein
MWIDTLDWRQLFLAFGITLGFFLTWQRMGEKPQREIGIYAQQYKSETLFAGLIALFGAWIGARVAFIFLHWSYYQIHQNEILQIWMGGLHWSGAILGGLILILLFAGIRNRSLSHLLDELFPLWVVLSVFLWISDAGNTNIQSNIWFLSQQPNSFITSFSSWFGAGIILLAGAIIDHKRFRNLTLLFMVWQFVVLAMFSFLFPGNSPGIGLMTLDIILSISYLVISVTMLILHNK